MNTTPASSTRPASPPAEHLRGNNRPRLLLLSGSLREDSFHSRLLGHLAPRLAAACRLDQPAAEALRLPLFDQDLEHDARVIARVAALHARVAASDGLVVASPEHNGLPSAALKNVVDWISRLPHVDACFGNAFLDRPVLLCSASTGWSGGAVAIPHARALFGHVGAVVLGDVLTLPYIAQTWTGAGFDFDPLLEMQIDDTLARIVALAKAHARRSD
jgi:chromate reductase